MHCRICRHQRSAVHVFSLWCTEVHAPGGSNTSLWRYGGAFHCIQQLPSLWNMSVYRYVYFCPGWGPICQQSIRSCSLLCGHLHCLHLRWNFCCWQQQWSWVSGFCDLTVSIMWLIYYGLILKWLQQEGILASDEPGLTFLRTLFLGDRFCLSFTNSAKLA